MDLQELGHLLRGVRKEDHPSPEEKLRGYRRVTQELLAERLGWKTASHVSEIETGQRRPEPTTLERWIEACRGRLPDLHRARGLAGYIPLTRLPRLNPLIRILDAVAESALAHHACPSYIIDYRGLIWAANAANMLFEHSYAELRALLQRPVNLLHLMFDRRLRIVPCIHDPLGVQLWQVRYFKSMNIRRQHEPFYRTLPERIARDLLPADAWRLRRAWDETEGHNRLQEPLHRAHIVCTLRGGHTDTFTVHDEYIKNFDHTFAVITFRPSEPGICARLVAPQVDAPLAVIKLWEIADLSSVLADYPMRH